MKSCANACSGAGPVGPAAAPAGAGPPASGARRDVSGGGDAGRHARRPEPEAAAAARHRHDDDHRPRLLLGDQVVHDDVRPARLRPAGIEIAAAVQEIEDGIARVRRVVVGRRVDVGLPRRPERLRFVGHDLHAGRAAPASSPRTAGRHLALPPATPGRSPRRASPRIARVRRVHAVDVERVRVDVRRDRGHRRRPDAIVALAHRLRLAAVENSPVTVISVAFGASTAPSRCDRNSPAARRQRVPAARRGRPGVPAGGGRNRRRLLEATEPAVPTPGALDQATKRHDEDRIAAAHTDHLTFDTGLTLHILGSAGPRNLRILSRSSFRSQAVLLGQGVQPGSAQQIEIAGYRLGCAGRAAALRPIVNLAEHPLIRRPGTGAFTGTSKSGSDPGCRSAGENGLLVVGPASRWGM